MMSTDQEQELKTLINQRFDDLDKTVTHPSIEIKDLSTETKILKVDLSWIKWILGLFGSLIIVLLSVILTVTFKLIVS